jgi:hypothetical protein
MADTKPAQRGIDLAMLYPQHLQDSCLSRWLTVGCEFDAGPSQIACDALGVQAAEMRQVSAQVNHILARRRLHVDRLVLPLVYIALATGVGAVAVVIFVTNSSGLRGGIAAVLALASAVVWWLTFARAARRHKAFQLATRDMQSYLDTTINPRYVRRGLLWGYVTRPRHAGETYSTYVNMCLGFMVERARFTVNVNHAYAADGKTIILPADGSGSVSSGEDSPRMSAGNVSTLALPAALATRRHSMAPPPPPPPPRRASIAPPAGLAEGATPPTLARAPSASTLPTVLAAAPQAAVISVAAAGGTTVTLALPTPPVAMLPPPPLPAGGVVLAVNPLATSRSSV